MAGVQRGCVAMLGQKMTVRLVEELDQSQQRLVRFEYQVTTEDSPYFGKLDTSGRGAGPTCVKAPHTTSS